MATITIDIDKVLLVLEPALAYQPQVKPTINADEKSPLMINELAAEAGHPDFLSGLAWSSTESGTAGAWYVYFGSGNVTGSSKYCTVSGVRPVATL